MHGNRANRKSSWRRGPAAPAWVVAAASGLAALAAGIAVAEDEPGDAPSRVVIEGTKVEAEREDYVAEEATSGTRLPAPVLETPQSVQVVPDELLEDRAVFDPQEAIRNVSGVQRGSSRTGVGESYLIRGFPQQGLFKDGFRAGQLTSTAEFTFEAPTEVANLDRIEVLKGPSAILYGRGEPGGTVNYVTRLPEFANRGEIQQHFGSFDFYRTELHANGAAIPGVLAGRIDGAYQNAGTFVERTEGERFFLAPAFRWNVGSATAVTFRGEYLNDDHSTSLGFPIIDGRPIPGVPYDRYFGEPDVTEIAAETFRGLVSLEHDWTDGHRTTLSLHGVRTDAEGTNFLLFNFAGPLQDPETGEIARASEVLDFDGDYATPRLEHVWETTLFGAPGERSGSALPSWLPETTNQLLVSVEWDRQEIDGHRILSGHSPLDPFRPRYTGYAPQPLIPGFPVVFFEERDDDLEATSILFLDRVSFGDDGVLFFGGRQEWFDATSRSAFSPDGLFPGSDNEVDESTFDPFVGLLWKPVSPVALFASYSTSTFSFQNITLTTVNGETLDAERARQLEVGAKAEALDGKLFATTSLFQIDKTDVAGTDPANPFFSVNAGEERSRGVEVDVAGEPVPGWRLIASYAHVDARITDDPTGANDGNRRFGVPEHSGGFFTTWEQLRGPLEGLAAGCGLFASDRTALANSNDVTLPGWAQVDALLSYRYGPALAQLNVKNVFDQEFFYAGNLEVGRSSEVQRAASRTVIGSVQVGF